MGTISGLDTNDVNYTFTINRDAAKSTTNAALMYVDNGSTTQWGFHIYDCNGDGVSDITGHWNDGDKMYKQDTNYSQISDLSGDTVTAVINQNKNLPSTNMGGTRLHDGTDTTATAFYHEPSLVASSSQNGNIQNAVFNTNLVKTITVKDEGYQISAGDVSTVLSRANTAIFDGSGKHEISNVNDDRLANGEDADGNEVIKNIVVAGTSQLFLNSWGSGQTLVVDRDIYIGQTSYTEGEYSNAAIRFGNNGNHETDLDGTLYVIEDAILKATNNEKAINLNGGVTDIINGKSANSTLTFRGKGYNIYSDVNLGGLVVDSNSKVTFADESSLTIGSTIDNKGTLVLNGTLAVRNDDLSGFDSQIIGDIADVTENGLFDIGTKYILIKGNALDASSDTTTVSYNGQTYSIANGITIGEKGFAVVESDKTVTLGGSNATEGTADVAHIYVHGGKLAIAEGTYTVNTSAAGNCDIIYTAGSMTLAADATLQTVSGNISSIVKNSTGSGTLEIGSGVTNLIAGNDTYGYDGKISVKSGGQLNLNQEGSGANSMQSITLANATIDMDGGRVRYFGGSATIGTINVNANSTFEAFASWSGDREGIVTINNMNVTKDLTIEGQYESSMTIKDLTLNGTMLLNANSDKAGAKSNVTIEKLSGTGMLQLQMGHYTIGAGTHTIDRIDASKGGNNTGTLTLAADANLTVNRMWVGLQAKTKGIKLGKGASLTHGDVKFTGTTESDSSISRVTDGNHGDEYGIGNASYVISNAAVEVTSAENKTMYNRLMGVALTNSGTGKLTAGNGYNNLTELKALTGDIDLTWYNGQGNQGTISNLHIAAGRTVGAYTKDAGSTKATITAGGLTIGNAATLNANLVLNNGAALTFDGALAMGGSTLTLGTGLTLNQETLDAIKSLTGDERFELFTGVGALTLGDETFKMGENVLDATNAIDLSKYFALVSSQTPAFLSDEQLNSGYYLGFDANGTVYAGLVPEPTTATLSLLALAALAARRRRK